MRRSPKKVIRTERIETAALAVLSGIGALAAAAALLSAFAAVFDFSGAAINAMSGVALAAGCFACSFCTANRRRKNGLAVGFICGLAVFGAALFIGALTVKIFTAQGIAVKLAIILSASALGGYKGVNSRPVFRR